MLVDDFKVDGSFVRSYCVDGKQIYTKSGKLFGGMKSRCTLGKSAQKGTTYQGCSSSVNFENYQYFANWCQSQIGYNFPDFCLDKDILGTGDTYSEHFCVFVPRRINNLILKSDKIRGEYPIGVSKDCNKYRADCRLGFGRKSKYLGAYYDTASAFNAYKVFKEKLIKEVAEEFKDKIDPRVYAALLNYKINIED